jgi:hypothetical protein
MTIIGQELKFLPDFLCNRNKTSNVYLLIN